MRDIYRRLTWRHKTSLVKRVIRLMSVKRDTNYASRDTCPARRTFWRVCAKFHLNVVVFFKSQSSTKPFIQLGHVVDISLIFAIW